jgi:hypothetical protein
MGNLFGGGKKSEPAPYVPPAPAPTPIKDETKKKLRQGAEGKTQTVFTSPLGASESVNLTGKKEQLGA